jgi:glycosyltransferase involved in cell wall biosynthesis
MRVCVINEYFHPDNTGGTGTVLSELARTLTDRYSDVTIDVITSRNLYRGNHELEPSEDWNGIKITRIATPKPNGLSMKARLAANLHFSARSLGILLSRPKWDVVLIGTAPPTVTVAADWYRKIRGVPYVYIVYDLEPDRAVVTNLLPSVHPAVKMLRRYQKRWLHNAHSVVVLGRCMRDYVSKQYDLPQSKLKVIPIGADPEAIIPGSHDTKFRRTHGIHGKVVLYSGNFGRYHDFDTILDAAVDLQTSQPDITFVLVGDGAQREHIEQRVREQALSNVRLFPFVPEKDYNDLLASADISLVTLEPGMEGLCVPSKFYSILASGRPTIGMMSEACEVARVLKEERCGICVPVGDAGQLISAIDRLCADDHLRGSMGQNARTALSNKYSVEVVAELYYQALSEGAGLSDGSRGVVSDDEDARLATADTRYAEFARHTDHVV